MRSYYDTLLEHLGNQYFVLLNENWQAYLYSLHSSKLNKVDLSLEQEQGINNCFLESEKNKMMFEAYRKLIIQLDSYLENDLAEILGSYYQSWQIEKNKERFKNKAFHFRASFESWLSRHPIFSLQLANYHQEAAKRMKAELFLQAIERFYSAKPDTDPAIFYLPQLDKVNGAGDLQFDFDSRTNYKRKRKENTYSWIKEPYFRFELHVSELINLKAKASITSIEGLLQDLLVVNSSVNQLIDKALISKLRGQDYDSFFSGLNKDGWSCFKEQEPSSFLFCTKVDFNLILNGDFESDDLDVLHKNPPAFFPFYLQLKKEDEINFSLLGKALRIEYKSARGAAIEIASICELKT